MTAVRPPQAARKPHVHEAHGDSRSDDWHWLRAENWQEVMREPERLPADIRTYLEAENAYAEAALADVATLRETLFAELKGRLQDDDSSVPAKDGPWAYYRRYRPGGEQPLFCRRPAGDAGGTAGAAAATGEVVLLDGEAEARGVDYFDLGALAHSPGHDLVAWSADRRGSEYYEIRVRPAGTDRDLDDRIPDSTGSVVWGNDGQTLYYVRLDENHRPSRVYRHRLGTPVESDELVYEETGPGWFVGISKTESRRFVVVSVRASETSEMHLLDADDPAARPRLVAAREEGVKYSLSHRGDELVILTNADGAEDFKLVTAPLSGPGRENWRDLLAHRPGTLLRGLMLYADYLVRLEVRDALPALVIRDLADGTERTVAFAEEAYALGLDGSLEFDSGMLRFSYASPSTPERIFDLDMSSGERTLMKEQQVPSGHDPADYVVRRIEAPTADGERVPVTVLHAADTPLDGSAPLLLYGYGSYGMSMPASFSPHRLGLVQRGFVHAIAHVRGGMERGYRWYTAGKLMKKRNTFEDFIAAAETLCEAGFGRAGEIAIQGGSAGGLLVGATMNLRPDLFRAVVAEVPFVDVLTTILDDSLPLTPPEWTEWGNPIESEEAYRYMKSYSPYDNVEAGAYPDLLITAGLTDPRVTYWEPAKWSAKLRALRTDDNLQLLHTVMTAGHAGSAGRYDRLKEIALVQAFLLKVFGRAGE